MFNIGDYLVYEKEVCKVIQIKEKYYNDTDYYILTQISDSSLKRELPVDNEKIRPLLKKRQIKKIINEVPKIIEIEILKDNHKMIETEYRKLMNSGKHEDLLKIIKTSYLRIKEKIDNNKQKSTVDETYLKLAETNLYTEISVVLGISYEEAKKTIIDKLTEF